MSQQQGDGSDNHSYTSAPTTPGQAEGAVRPEEQSKTSEAPTQPDQAEGEVEDAEQ